MSNFRTSVSSLGLAALVSLGIEKPAQAGEGATTELDNIVFEVGSERVTATLNQTPAARAFATMLPLTVDLSDFGGGTEKIADLPASIPTVDAAEGFTPTAGIFAYYEPWGNLAIFRQDFRYSVGLIELGHFTSDFSPIDQDGEFNVTISISKD